MTQAHHINPLPDPIVIGIAGHAGAGKDTAAAYLVERYGFVQASFADPIRSMALLLLEEAGIDHRWLTDPAYKHRRISGLQISGEELTNALFNAAQKLHPQLWVRHLAMRLGLSVGFGAQANFPIHDRIVISDVQHQNLADWIHRVGGKLIRLHRAQADEVRPPGAGLDVDVDIHNHGNHFAGLHGQLDRAMASWCIGERDALAGGDADPAAHNSFTYF